MVTIINPQLAIERIRKEKENDYLKTVENKKVNKDVCEHCEVAFSEYYYYCPIHKTSYCYGCVTNNGRKEIPYSEVPMLCCKKFRFNCIFEKRMKDVN